MAHSEARFHEARGKRQFSLTGLSLLAVVIGIVTGLGAIVLRYLIGILHNLFFLGELSAEHDAITPTPPSPFGPFIILAPVIGGLIVLFLVRRFAPEAKGGGVSEVMDVIYYKGGRIRPQVVLIKALASALSIGSGASVGREGPIIQIGSGIGSVLGQRFDLRRWQVITMVAAGAGAGIAASFNTPLGAVLFAVEVLLPEFSPRTLIPVVLATGTATYMGRLAFGIEPLYLVATSQRPDLFVPLSADMLPLFVFLGLFGGLAAATFIRSTYETEAFFDRLDRNPYVKNALGMGALGVLMYVVMLTTGMYHTAGVGDASVQQVLTGQMTAPLLLLMLFALKMLATAISLGAGASGGVFGPSLYLGAMLGGAFGAALDLMFPSLGFDPVTFALIGMAAMVGAGTGAALSSIIMIFEMTGDYTITVGAIIAVVVAVGMRRSITADNLFTIKLTRAGHRIPSEIRSHLFPIRRAGELMEPVVAVIDEADLSPHSLVVHRPRGKRSFAVVTRGRHIVGVAPVDPDDPRHTLGAVVGPVGIVRESTFLQTAMTHMADRGHAAVVVMKDGGAPRAENVVGAITRVAIGAAVIEDYRS
jgi:CIC family chloride channel protein